MRLMHNLESLNIYREHTKVLSRQSTAMSRISSGYKINSAKENPNAIASSEKMRIQIRGLQMAQRNAQDGVSMLQTSEGALDNVTSMLQRIRELTIQAGGVTSKDDRDIIQNEIVETINSIDNIVKGTDFNGVNLLNTDAEPPATSYDNNNPTKNKSMPVGANVGEIVKISMYNLSVTNLPDGIDNLNKLTEENALEKEELGIDGALSIIDSALNTVLSVRSEYGALSNRFDSTYNKIGEIHDTIVGAESKIRDTDVAEEMMNFARDSVLIDAGHAMMVQSNKFPQDILRILENVRSR